MHSEDDNWEWGHGVFLTSFRGQGQAGVAVWEWDFATLRTTWLYVDKDRSCSQATLILSFFSSHQIYYMKCVYTRWPRPLPFLFLGSQIEKQKQGRPRNTAIIWGLLSNAALLCISWYQEAGNFQLSSFQWLLTRLGKVTGTFQVFLECCYFATVNNINMRDFLHIVLSWET